MTPAHVLLLLTSLSTETTSRPLVFVTPPGWAAATAAPTSNSVARAAAKGGASLVQLRDADASMDRLETAAAAVRDALQGTDGSVIISGVGACPAESGEQWNSDRPDRWAARRIRWRAVLAAAALGADYVQLGTMFAAPGASGRARGARPRDRVPPRAGRARSDAFAGCRARRARSAAFVDRRRRRRRRTCCKTHRGGLRRRRRDSRVFRMRATRRPRPRPSAGRSPAPAPVFREPPKIPELRRPLKTRRTCVS